LLLCSRCFAAIAFLRRMLCRHVARAVALLPESLRSSLSDRYFATVSVMTPYPRLCRLDGRRLWRMLCYCGLFSSGCFAAVVVPAPLADVLPPRLSLLRRLCGFTTLLTTNVLSFVLGLVSWVLRWRVPLAFSCCLFMPVGFRW
jgi:hypothetical protein